MDIDLDFFNRNEALQHFKHIVASRKDRDTLIAHNSGVYVHDIPHDPLTKLSTIDYKTAASRNYFKIDFLNVSVYQGVTDADHLTRLMETEPIWELLLQDDFTDLLFHLNGHGDILRKTPPISVEQLAAVLAMIRPAKRYLIGSDWTTIMNEIWIIPESLYYWKKSHAFSYATVVIVQMNLICEQLFGSNQED